MRDIRVSPKFQVVIPKEVREALAIRPGDRFRVEAHEGRIELIPLRKHPSTARGFLRGIDSSVPRDPDRV